MQGTCQCRPRVLTTCSLCVSNQLLDPGEISSTLAKKLSVVELCDLRYTVLISCRKRCRSIGSLSHKQQNEKRRLVRQFS